MAGKRKVDMAKVKKGLAVRDEQAEPLHVRVLLVGGTPEARTAMARLVADALEGYTVSIRDGGS